MKTGDAELTLWLDQGDRHWCLSVVSRRRGKQGSPRWEIPVYDWWVELWGDDPDQGEIMSTKPRTAQTFAEALRLARRWAAALDQARRR